MFAKEFKRFIKNTLIKDLGDHIITYPTPKNLSYNWSYGALSGICLIIQFLTGLFLSMHYVPNTEWAFLSVEHIMRDVNYGWIIRYTHSNCASAFFIVIFMHLFRNIYFGSYQQPRALTWITGVIIFLLVMATAFLGYILPWGQMSFWGATVITNLFSAIPTYGPLIVEWLWGGFSVGQPTLNRFYSLHFFLPFLIISVSIIHIGILHTKGSSNPVALAFIERAKYLPKSTNLPFFHYYVIKDIMAIILGMLIAYFLIFILPNILGHPDNYIKAEPMVTPAHIVPEWYFLPFYAILRSIPNKLGGVIAMLFAIIGWLILPCFDSSQKGTFYSRNLQAFYFTFALNFFILGWIGQQPVESPYTEVGIICTILYFLLLFIFLPTMYVIDHIESPETAKKTRRLIRDHWNKAKKSEMSPHEEHILKRNLYFAKKKEEEEASSNVKLV